MTDKSESDVTSTELGEGGKEQTPEEAAASFAAGFEEFSTETVTLGDEPKPTETIENTEAAPADESIGEVHTPEQVVALQKRLRKMEGQYGSLNKQFKELLETVKSQPGGATSVQQEELNELQKHQKALEASVGEFSELLPFKTVLESVSQDVEQLKQNLASVAPTGSLTPDRVQQIVNEGILGYAHSDWDQVARSPEFRAFMLQGGPSEDEYKKYSLALNDPGSASQASEFVSDWELDYPQWWADRGKDLFSDDVGSTIKVLDRYKEAKAASTEHQNTLRQQQQRRQQRLKSSAAPQGVGGDPATGLSDDEAFRAGFKEALG